MNKNKSMKVQNRPGMVVFLPVVLALRRLRQEDYMFKASLSYIVKPCLRKTDKTKLN
jgi:hypothetical protein